MPINDSTRLDEALAFLQLEAKHYISTRKGRRFLLSAMERVRFLIDEEQAAECGRLRQILRGQLANAATDMAEEVAQ